MIGAGQAGLAAGYYLKQAGRDFLILDANERVGDNWRKRWVGLRLFSPQRYNRLPGLAPPEDDDHLPTRLDLADYLEDYAQEGRSACYPEVTFLGLPNLRRPSSSLVGGVGRDAKALLG